jgi:hypothetical protein
MAATIQATEVVDQPHWHVKASVDFIYIANYSIGTSTKMLSHLRRRVVLFEDGIEHQYQRMLRDCMGKKYGRKWL